jgi:hypothetical protein
MEIFCGCPLRRRSNEINAEPLEEVGKQTTFGFSS